jgi:hypothetical protein
LRAAAIQRGARRKVAAHLDADHELLAFRGIATGQDHAPLACRFIEPPGKLVQPIRVGFDEGQRQRHPAGFRAHRGNVREIDGDDAITDVACIHVSREVCARNHRVDDGHQISLCRRPKHGTVVADAGYDHRRVRMPRKKAADQFELIHCLWP